MLEFFNFLSNLPIELLLIFNLAINNNKNVYNTNYFLHPTLGSKEKNDADL